MTWTAYRIVFRLKSPLYVGHLKIGNLQRTRHYVPGKTLWGALTARLTRDSPRLGGDYEKVGHDASEQLAFSYFFPALDLNNPLYPNYTDDGLQYGPNDSRKRMTSDEFSWRLLSSYASTAVDARRTAAEGSLHEVEFLSPFDRKTQRSVYLVGYIFERWGCRLRWQEVLDRLQFGGERGYGWGRVSLYELGDPTEGEFNLFNRWVVDLRQQKAVITVPKDEPLLAHTCCDNLPAHGQIEPWLGRETLNPEQYGAKLSQAKVCWVPGSRVADESRLTIGRYGLWEALGPSNSNSAKIPGDRRRD